MLPLRARCWGTLVLCVLGGCARYVGADRPADGRGREALLADGHALDGPRDVRVEARLEKGSPVADSGACGKAGALFCSGFEKGLPGEWSAMEKQGLSIASDPVHAGTAALRSQGSSTLGAARLVWDLPVAWQGELHLRAFLYLPAALSSGTQVLLELADAPGAANKTSIDLTPGSLHLVNQAGGDHVMVNSPLPIGKWTCVELTVGSQGASVSVDTAVALSSAKTALPPSGFAHLFAGVYSMSGSFEALYDDVVLSASPVGCQ